MARATSVRRAAAAALQIKGLGWALLTRGNSVKAASSRATLVKMPLRTRRDVVCSQPASASRQPRKPDKKGAFRSHPHAKFRGTNALIQSDQCLYPLLSTCLAPDLASVSQSPG